MKYPVNRRRKVALWLGLFTALAASAILASRLSRGTDSIAPVPERVQSARSSAGPVSSTQPVKRVSRAHTAGKPASPMPVRAEAMYPDLREYGCEMPFAVKDRVPVSTSVTETDPAVLRERLNTGTASVEIEAVRLLLQIGTEKALASALGKMLSLPATSPDYDRYLAAFSDCRSESVAVWLADFLGRATTEEVRQRAYAILGAMRSPEVIESLAVELADPVDQRHAVDCANILASASDPAQAESLRVLLEAVVAPEIQTIAAYGLASVGNAEACIALVRRGSSAEAISLVCRDALATVDSSFGQEILIQAAVDPAIPSAVRCAAVQALAGQHGQRVQTVLANLRQATSDQALQAAIDQALQWQLAAQSEIPRQALDTAGNAGIRGEALF